MTKNKMVRWHHQLNGQKFEQTLGVSEGQGSLTWGGKEVATEQQQIYKAKKTGSLYRINMP